MNKASKFILSVIIPLAVGGLSGYLTSGEIKDWYRTVEKPVFNPPDFVFGPVWTALYIMMGIAFVLVWKAGAESGRKRKAMTLYFLQLLLNFLWSLIFFGAHEIGWALVEIALLWVTIILTINAFRKISSLAAWLLVPYLCWVSFAAVLNFAIWKLN